MHIFTYLYSNQHYWSFQPYSTNFLAFLFRAYSFANSPLLLFFLKSNLCYLSNTNIYSNPQQAAQFTGLLLSQGQSLNFNYLSIYLTPQRKPALTAKQSNEFSSISLYFYEGVIFLRAERLCWLRLLTNQLNQMPNLVVQMKQQATLSLTRSSLERDLEDKQILALDLRFQKLNSQGGSSISNSFRQFQHFFRLLLSIFYDINVELKARLTTFIQSYSAFFTCCSFNSLQPSFSS